MKILVTGGAGFIGSHLCEKLLSLQHAVYCLDNFCDFYNPKIKRDNIKECLKHNEFVLFEGDIRDKEFVNELFSRHSFDKIIHLAAMAGVRPSINNPHLYYDVNVMGTVNLLDAIINNRSGNVDSLPNLIFASSSSVYGNNNKLPFTEDDTVDSPISPYAVTKRTGELICYNYHHLYGLPVVCLRLFTVYGSRQRPDLAIHKFARKIFNHEKISVFGDGSTERDYTYIDDVIQGIIKSIEYVKPDVYEIFNLGESKMIRLDRMIQTIEKMLNKEAIIEYLPLQPGDVGRTYASIEKSRTKLGYKPQFDFEGGVRQFVSWFISTME